MVDSFGGVFTTNQFVDGQRVKSWRNAITQLDVNGDVPLTAITNQAKSVKITDIERNVWDRDQDTLRVTLTGNIIAASSNLTVASGATSFKAGDLLQAEQTGEVMMIVADPVNATTLSVLRGFEGTTPTAINYGAAGVNPNLLYLGSAYEQGSNAPTGVQWRPTKRSNYVQIFQDTYEFTRTAKKTEIRTKTDVISAKQDCLMKLSMGMERAFLFGAKSAIEKNGKPLTTTDGLITQLIAAANATNVATADTSTGVDYDAFEAYMAAAFKYGSNQKVGFIGNGTSLFLQQLIRKTDNVQWQMVPGAKKFGMNFTEFVTPFGSLLLKRHPQFTMMTGGTTAGTKYYGYDNAMFILDPGKIEYFYIDDIQHRTNLQANDADGEKHGFLAECGVTLLAPKAHYLLKNLAVVKAA